VNLESTAHPELGQEPNFAQWQDCPGCEKCSPNDGLVLRKGAWRPTNSYEPILMLTKTNEYFCDQAAVKVPIAESTVGRGRVDFGGQKGRDYVPSADDPNFRNGSEQWGRTYDYQQSNSDGKANLRSVWRFPSRASYSPKFLEDGSKAVSHFAAFPEELPERCIKAATSEYGVCAECGSPYVRVLEGNSGGSTGHSWHNHENDSETGQNKKERTTANYEVGKTLGWRKSCSCKTDKRVPALVLDPFSGSATTLCVAKKMGRRSVGYELSEDYAKLSLERNRQSGMGI